MVRPELVKNLQTSRNIVAGCGAKVSADLLFLNSSYASTNETLMSDRPRPQEPLRNPSHIVFPKKGAPYPVVEQMPRDKEDLELAVGRKFIGALRHFEKIQLDGLARGTEPADLTCQSSDGTNINLQIVEVIDEKLRQLRYMRSTYRAALVQELGDNLRLFSGCRVSLVDSGDPPYLPNASSARGRECLRVLAELIRKVAADIHTLERQKRRSRKTSTRDPVRDVFITVERIVPAGESIPFSFEWTGGGPSYRIDVPRRLLSARVQDKIEKRYAKPVSGRFWLLLYSVDTLLSDDDPDIAESRRLLTASPQPFDKVWFLYLYVAKELGALLHIWRSAGAKLLRPLRKLKVRC